MEYQAPELIEIGSFEEMTLGPKFSDTADANAYQN
ncbi:lasso RiPP family leader peptide-containing protein [Shimazuella kribbensis]|nr:lasso RiPP family leader peptide-containing protein [Shimazuella kribbensis]